MVTLGAVEGLDEATVEGLTVLARTIWGEARGESWLGKVAVAWTVRNRVARSAAHRERTGRDYWFGGDVKTICLYRKGPWGQFSCWNPTDPNRSRIERVSLDEPQMAICCAAALAVMSGVIDDPTGGSCHYHVAGLRATWSIGKTPTVEIGRHVFYAGIR